MKWFRPITISFAVCLSVSLVYARRVTCPRCGGSGVIPGPVIHGIQSYYGCPDCGGSGGGGSPGSRGRGWIEVPDSAQPAVENNQAADTEAARQAAEVERKRAIEEQQKKKQEEAARRQAAFDKAKQDALSTMKGLTGSESELKGIGTGDDMELKGVGGPESDGLKTLFDKSTRDAVDLRPNASSKLDIGGPGSSQAVGPNVVDLRHLDPNKAIVVDPNVVKGKPRRIPVQPGSSTPKGENYEKGFGELRKGDKGDPSLAVEYFMKAAAENPDNPLVRDALDLAKDLVRVREDASKSQEERERSEKAILTFADATEALRQGDAESAGDMLQRARAANPDDKNIEETVKAMQMYLYWAQKNQHSTTTSNDAKNYIAAVAGCSSDAMTLMLVKDYKHALEALDEAEALFADQYAVEDMNTTVGGKARPSPVDAENRAMMRVGLTKAREQVAQALEQSTNASRP